MGPVVMVLLGLQSFTHGLGTGEALETSIRSTAGHMLRTQPASWGTTQSVRRFCSFVSPLAAAAAMQARRLAVVGRLALALAGLLLVPGFVSAVVSIGGRG